MKQDTSFKDYAEYYDLIYADKDYRKEVDFLEEIFRDSKPENILEIGCGTGNYTKILLERGYRVTGVDVSGDMLKIAREKCNCNFVQSDIKNMGLNEKFDACIAMFAVIGYVTKNSDIECVLENVYKHLKPNGLFIFDVWNGLAVMRILPEKRLIEVENDKIKIIRHAVPVLKSFEHIVEVNYKLQILNKKNNRSDKIDEKHIMRFYFPQEIKYYLKNAGFEVLKICPFLDFNGNVDENIWNMTVVARALKGKR